MTLAQSEMEVYADGLVGKSRLSRSERIKARRNKLGAPPQRGRRKGKVGGSAKRQMKKGQLAATGATGDGVVDQFPDVHSIWAAGQRSYYQGRGRLLPPPTQSEAVAVLAELATAFPRPATAAAAAAAAGAVAAAVESSSNNAYGRSTTDISANENEGRGAAWSSSSNYGTPARLSPARLSPQSSREKQQPPTLLGVKRKLGSPISSRMMTPQMAMAHHSGTVPFPDSGSLDDNEAATNDKVSTVRNGARGSVYDRYSNVCRSDSPECGNGDGGGGNGDRLLAFHSNSSTCGGRDIGSKLAHRSTATVPAQCGNGTGAEPGAAGEGAWNGTINNSSVFSAFHQLAHDAGAENGGPADVPVASFVNNTTMATAAAVGTLSPSSGCQSLQDPLSELEIPAATGMAVEFSQAEAAADAAAAAAAACFGDFVRSGKHLRGGGGGGGKRSSSTSTSRSRRPSSRSSKPTAATVAACSPMDTLCSRHHPPALSSSTAISTSTTASFMHDARCSVDEEDLGWTTHKESDVNMRPAATAAAAAPTAHALAPSALAQTTAPAPTPTFPPTPVPRERLPWNPPAGALPSVAGREGFGGVAVAPGDKGSTRSGVNNCNAAGGGAGGGTAPSSNGGQHPSSSPVLRKRHKQGCGRF